MLINLLTFQWHKSNYKLSESGFGKSYLVGMGVYTDAKDSSKRTIILDKPSLGMSREYLIKGFDDKDVQHYFTYMKDTAEYLGADMDEAEQDLKDALLFEIKMAKATLPREKRRNSSLLYNPKILGEFEPLKDHLPSWSDYLDTLLYKQFNIGDLERVIVKDVAYFSKLDDILKDTKPRTIATYQGWRLAKSSTGNMNKDLKNIKLKYDKAISGVTANSPLWKDCVSTVGFNTYGDANLRIPAASMYVKKHFSPEAKSSMLEMISYIRKAFNELVEGNVWMGEKTKLRAKDKLKKMGQFIAYPDEILDQAKVDGLHKDLEVMAINYLNKIFS